MILTNSYEYQKNAISGDSFSSGQERSYDLTFSFDVESIISLKNFDYHYKYIDIKEYSVSGNVVTVVLKNNAPSTYSSYTGLLFCSVSGKYI